MITSGVEVNVNVFGYFRSSGEDMVNLNIRLTYVLCPLTTIVFERMYLRCKVVGVLRNTSSLYSYIPVSKAADYKSKNNFDAETFRKNWLLYRFMSLEKVQTEGEIIHLFEGLSELKDTVIVIIIDGRQNWKFC